MQPGRRQADESIAGDDALSVDQPGARNCADDESRHVVLAISIEAGHLGGLATEQRAAVLTACRGKAFDNLDRDVRIKTAGRKVVEEEERRSTLDEDVVDAVIDEIATDRSMLAGHEGDLQLRADTVGARDEHRILDAGGIHAEQTAERADVRQDARGIGPLRQSSNASDDFVAGVDVYASLAVIHRWCAARTRASG